MSCRVLKRGMEVAMFDALIEQCVTRGIRKIVGVCPFEEERHGCGALDSLGFSRVETTSEGRELWHWTCLRPIRTNASHSPAGRDDSNACECLLLTRREQDHVFMPNAEWQVEVDRWGA